MASYYLSDRRGYRRFVADASAGKCVSVCWGCFALVEKAPSALTTIMDLFKKLIGQEKHSDYLEKIPEALTPEHFDLHKVSRI